MRRFIPYYGVLLLLIVSSASAQFFYFGRNKVQYTDFDWHVLKTEHFDIYYYPEMKDLAERGASIAEESYKVLEQKFNHNVLNRIPLIFYSSHLHFQQTNTTPDFIPEGVGGFFEFLKGRVVIPYDGSMWNFRHVICHELVHVFMHSKINRVLLDHRMAQDHLPPLWFVEGLAEFWSTEWDIQAEMVMRDAVVSGYLVPLSDMDRIFGTFLMYKEGQNILEFIAGRYGQEKILLLMENFWKSGSFDEIFKLTFDKNYTEFDREWTYALKKKYYPLLSSSDQPSAVSKPIVIEGFNSKPVYYHRGNRKEIYFIGNHTGYTSIFRVRLDSTMTHKPEVVIEGEKTDEFEAFHLFQSKLDISSKGILAFVTKSGENDALHLYDIEKEEIVETYHFKDLVVLGSPAWSPDGRDIVFTAVDKSGSSDLYVWDVDSSMLTRLTNDIYDERDPEWSPSGGKIVFSSDRTPFGEHGKYNLFLYDFSTHDILYLTYGDESYTAPRWSGDGRSLIFTSDRGGARNVWMLRFDSASTTAHEMRKITELTTAAFDPAWADTNLIFVAFEDFSFQIRSLSDINAAYDSSKTTLTLNIIPTEKPWKPKTVAGESEVKSFRYTGEYSLDIAQSQIATDPVFGTNGGAFLSLSDLLGNEQYYFLIYNTAQSSDELLSSFNIAISRISLQQRANYAYGIYRFSGRRYDLTDPDLFFFEKVFGGYFTLSYPISKFRRVATALSVSNSEKDASDLPFTSSSGGSSNIDLARRALFLSNSISFTHDNSLWGPSGPIDGSRFNITLGYTTDIQYSNANYYSIILDYRHYLRIAQRSAYAVRLWLFYNEGREARRFFMGGSWDLRGYERFKLRGKKLWLISNELRFPFVDQLAVRFPIGGLTLVGIRGALFFDAGNAWDDVYTETLGSIGGGVRMNLGGALVLRYDIGKRIEENFSHLQPGLFYQFFFGWDF
ncbi:MAG: PD40 domain-containing protein [Ignavibacteria bacterium]|nr:PD40 domain-containing protein [Ignavibacteria bacterium]